MTKPEKVASKKVAIYARVSTKDKGQETANQTTVMETFADKRNWSITHHYTENESGGKADRPK
ncbi:hypothetical protein LCGC14_2971610, partial [marine sediment metagenome]